MSPDVRIACASLPEGAFWVVAERDTKGGCRSDCSEGEKRRRATLLRRLESRCSEHLETGSASVRFAAWGFLGTSLTDHLAALLGGLQREEGQRRNCKTGRKRRHGAQNRHYTRLYFRSIYEPPRICRRTGTSNGLLHKEAWQEPRTRQAGTHPLELSVFRLPAKRSGLRPT